MIYQIEGELWSDVFAVPGVIVDEHIKLCGAASLKALLLILRRGGKGEAEEIALQLSLSPADLADALNYWVHLGVLREAGQAPMEEDVPPVRQPESTGLVYELPVPSPPPKEEEPEPALEQEEQRPLPGASRQKLTTRQINEMSRSDENIAFLLQEAQSVLGKPLTPVATDTIAALYSYYGMSPDLVLMLLQYCVSLGKDSMRYVEKVAAGWMEAGIDSHEKAEAEIVRASQRNQAEGRIRRMFGIGDRTLISSERKYIHSWTEELGCSDALITLAYERTVEQKGKLSFAYLNGILQNWHAKGIKTPSQAEQEMLTGKRPPVAPSGEKQSGGKKVASYDMSELEELTYGAK